MLGLDAAGKTSAFRFLSRLSGWVASSGEHILAEAFKLTGDQAGTTRLMPPCSARTQPSCTNSS